MPVAHEVQLLTQDCVSHWRGIDAPFQSNIAQNLNDPYKHGVELMAPFTGACKNVRHRRGYSVHAITHLKECFFVEDRPTYKAACEVKV